MSGSNVFAPSLQPSPVSTTGCSKHDKIVDLASLRERGLRLMDRVVRDAIVTQGSATESGWWRVLGAWMLACSERLLKLVRTQNIISFHGTEGVDIVAHVASDGVRGFPEFAVTFCKDEVGPHAAPN